MILKKIRLSNFQCFGIEPTEILFDQITYLIGPNGSGKTAVLQALCRMFSINPALRRLKPSDFHVPYDEVEIPTERQLWIEAEFETPEILNSSDESVTIPPMFNHMRLRSATAIPAVRFRLEASMGFDGDIDDPTLLYILDTDDQDKPINSHKVSRSDRNKIQVHYLPARRDPSDHVAFNTNALLGRLLRSANWSNERERIKGLTNKISENLSESNSISLINSVLKEFWIELYKGNYFVDPKVNFSNSELESLLRHMSVSFSPGHDQNDVDFSQLSDGQKSMLYLSLVLTSQTIGRKTLDNNNSFDIGKLNPPTFTIITLEEPENSLSPHFLGRIVSSLNKLIDRDNTAQALIATHSPSILKRIEPEQIRYLRLNTNRQTKISYITLPNKSDEEYKFVRQAVRAYPEIYFSKLVVLGEGDSEEIVIPRLLEARGILADMNAITIAPLGGRHVNHFWRLLSDLGIPYITLLDLDMCRYQGGWGRIKYVNDQLTSLNPKNSLLEDFCMYKWNDENHHIRNYDNYFTALENKKIFFSSPLDLDFSMIKSYPAAYGVTKEDYDDYILTSVLGQGCLNATQQYTKEELQLFSSYHKKFKLSSKPTSHINALSNLSNKEILDNMPKSYIRMIDTIENLINELPE